MESEEGKDKTKGDDDVEAVGLEVDVADEQGRQFRISIKRLRSKLGPQELELSKKLGRTLVHSPNNMT